ncbi:C45 family autoproteolytic acyltransferase/hydolase [Candidatus Protochlamydia phocaeensis]|uniref:C45 family autoproteolytic acyltransferase/hydolase n=1 Tax=Candidatus Protochlamydia phocaeensis TaxID=1414722 RepID=UPI000838299C|nr:C45 family autoproteolytic acyltransferase/hydolase [Candidatus Protochlamydia phocaeensis]
MKKLFILLLFICQAFSLQGAILSMEGDGYLEEREGQRILHLKGSPYDMGYQHGSLLKADVTENIQRFIDERILTQSMQEPIKSFLTRLPSILPYVPARLLEELRGVADGAGVPYEKVILLNVFPEMFHCTGLTVSGQATLQKELYHVRVLDYGAGKGLQNSAVLIVAEPERGIPFLNVSYAGFIGCITGMNAEKIAIGEIGGKGYGQWDGLPMAFLLRTLLERASSLEEIRKILAETPRTCEYFYVFSDGKNSQSLGVYATPQQLHFIEPGSSYSLFDLSSVLPAHPDVYKVEKAVFNQLFVESSLFQTVLYQDAQKEKIFGLIHHQLPDCVILTGFTRPYRYPILIERLQARYGSIQVSDLQDMIKAPVACPTNLHNAIFAPGSLEVWIAHAGPNEELACDQPYHHFSLSDLLMQK